MGRKPTVNKNLPPRMRKRAQRSGVIYYYYDTGGRPRKEIPLGNDFVQAVRQWSELEKERAPTGVGVVTFRYAAIQYCKDVLPTKAARTQSDNLKELAFLYQFFDDPPVCLEDIRPLHVRQYLQWRESKAREWYQRKKRPVPDRPGHVRANREIALFSHIFNYAREFGLTDATNPCVGVKKNSESGRDVYIEDDVFQLVWTQADEPTRDAMDLAYLTGQRPADTLKFDETDIRDGNLYVGQNKTGKRLRIEVKGELDALIKRIRKRKRGIKVVSTRLVINESGQPLRYDALRQRFHAARERAGVPIDSFQFRDLRAKAGTDKTETSGDIRQAQRQLGHKSLSMTEHYVRQRRGDKVDPTR